MDRNPDASQIIAQLARYADQSDSLADRYDDPIAIRDVRRAQYLTRRAAQILKDARDRQHNPHRVR